MWRVCELRHQTGAQYSAVEWTRARVAVRRVFAPVPHPEPASRLKSATRADSFLRSDGINVTVSMTVSICWCLRYICNNYRIIFTLLLTALVLCR